MNEKQVCCAFWGGKCKAMSVEEGPNLMRSKRQWIREGADEIKLLPLEEAKAAFLEGLS